MYRIWRVIKAGIAVCLGVIGVWIVGLFIATAGVMQEGSPGDKFAAGIVQSGEGVITDVDVFYGNVFVPKGMLRVVGSWVYITNAGNFTWFDVVIEDNMRKVLASVPIMPAGSSKDFTVVGKTYILRAKAVKADGTVIRGSKEPE